MDRGDTVAFVLGAVDRLSPADRSALLLAGLGYRAPKSGVDGGPWPLERTLSRASALRQRSGRQRGANA